MNINTIGDTRVWNENEFGKILKAMGEFNSDNIRASIIVFGSSIELLLELTIYKFLHISGQDLEKIGVSTFDRKIKLARLQNLIDDTAYEVFNAVRLIRNEFAHNLTCNFSDEKIQKQIAKVRKIIKTDELLERLKKDPPQTRVEIEELRYLCTKIYFYFRQINKLTEYQKAPSDVFRMIDIVSETKPKGIDDALYFPQKGYASISLNEVNFSFAEINVEFQIEQKTLSTSVFTVLLNDSTQLLKLYKTGNVKNEFALILDFNGKQVTVSHWQTKTYKNKLKVKIEDSILTFCLNGEEHIHYLPIKNGAALSELLINHHGYKDPKIKQYSTRSIMGVFNITIYNSPESGPIFSYCASCKRDHRMLKRSGEIPGMKLGEFDLENCIAKKFI